MNGRGAAAPRAEVVIFDLDGTLVDSLPGVQASFEWAVQSVLPERTPPDIRPAMGKPIRAMLTMALGAIDGTTLDAIATEFRLHYDVEGCRLSAPYPGVAELLEALDRAQTTMLLLTNKRLAPTQNILNRLGWRRYFRAVQCSDSREPPFTTKAEALEQLVEQMGLLPTAAVLVGDSLDDLEAAKRCGISFIAAAYGYGQRWADSPAIPAYRHLTEPASLLNLIAMDNPVDSAAPINRTTGDGG